MAAAIGA
ncbi:hypothetical protein COW38_00260, partial [Candidatus Collierbacteria bacterium CG17_big_fil_post_rev_8_21_14_2_50_45_7]